MSHDWIAFAKQLRAITQTGQTCTDDRYGLDRYRRLEGLTSRMFAVLGDVPVERGEPHHS